MDKILCYVDWEDAVCFPSKELKEVLNDKTIVRTFGILEYQDEKYHIIMTHDGGDDEDCDRMKIPSSLVRKITKLREVENE